MNTSFRTAAVRLFLMTAGLLALVVSGCSSGGGTPSPGTGSGGNGGGPPGPLPRSTTAKWTVLVYMNAANNLEPYSVENMDQMEQAPFNTQVNLVVQWKRYHSANTIQDDATFDTIAPEFDGTRRYWLTGTGTGRFGIDQVQDLGSGPVGSNPQTVDMGNWRTLRDFIQWGKQNFPAQHYLLLLWNHGAGWEHRGVIAHPANRGISYDDATNNSIETWQLPHALTGTDFDVLAMDASLMQMVEVAYEIRNSTTYVVGSEDSPPGDGYPYQLWVPRLTASPDMSPLTLADLIADTHASYYSTHPDSSGHFSPVTQSVVQTSALPFLANAISNLADVLTNDSAGYAAQFARARDSSDVYANDGFCSSGSCYPEFKDLVQYVTFLEQYAGSAPGLTSAAEAVKAAVNNAVVDNRATRLDALDAAGRPFSHGLSIYVPLPASAAQSAVGPPQTYDATYYPLLAFARDTHWANWLASQRQ